MKRLLSLLTTAALILSYSGVAMAAADVTGQPDSSAKWAIALGSGLAIAIAAFGAALGLGRMAAAAMESIGRNPNAREQIFIPMVLGLAFIEALALYGLVIAYLLQAKI